MTYKQSPEELENHLKEQLAFLRSSADAFDGGNEAEAKRMAAHLRTLLHDGRTSKSVLGQLYRKEMTRFVDSSFPPILDNVIPHLGLVLMEMGAHMPGRWLAPLDLPGSSQQSPRIPFGDWWPGVVFDDGKGTRLTRKDVVLSVAEQDGGVHVDPTLNIPYAELSRRNAAGWMAFDGNETRPVKGLERVTVRQIAHEVLSSLIEGYSKTMQGSPNAMGIGQFGVVDITDELNERKAKAQAEAIAKNLSRNAPCPCGQGRKFKNCCGAIAHGR